MESNSKFAAIIAIAVVIVMSSCSQNNGSRTGIANKSNKAPSGQCYVAAYKGDTALLSINQTSTGVEGTLKFIKADWNVDNGTIKGTFKGDTLLADYNFKSHDGRWYRNPIALLKKDDKLYLGVGQFETAWGRTYFAKNVPLDYENGKYVFDERQCP